MIILVDGKNALYRHHYVNKALTRDDGHPTGALHGCLQSMISLSRRLPEASFVWVWDGDGETWRHTLMSGEDFTQPQGIEEPEEGEDMSTDYVNHMVSQSMNFLGMSGAKPTPKKRKPKTQGYKANRVHAEEKKGKDNYPTDDRSRALLQMRVLRLVLRGIGVRQFQIHHLEADDLIAMLARRIRKIDDSVEVIVHSGDKDYYQLLGKVKILLRLTQGKLQWVTPGDVQERFGVHVNDWVKYRALTGDSSDNIPHIWKVGPKTALRMLDAGIDASEPDYRKIDPECFTKFARFFHPGPEKTWGSVYGNYKLCKMVDRIDSELLSDEVRTNLETMFEPLTSIRKFRGRQSQRNPENWRKVSHLLSSYELNQVLAQLEDLWRIP